MRLLKLLIPSLLICYSCYSTEFHPAKDYHQLQGLKSRPEEVKLIFHQPTQTLRFIGMMRVRDVQDWKADSFKRYVKNYAADRGATTAWIIYNREQLLKSKRTMGLGLGHGYHIPLFEVGSYQINEIPVALFR